MIEILRTVSAPAVSIPTSACPASWYAVRSRSASVITICRSAPRMIFSIASVKSSCSTAVWSAARREQRGLVHDQRDVGAGGARRGRRDLLEIHGGGERNRPRVDLQDLDAPGLVGWLHRDAAVESARAQQRLDRGSRAGSSPPSTITFVPGSNPSISVRIWLSVCSRSSWPPLMPPAPPERDRPIASSSSMKTMAGRRLLRLLEQVAHARGADADDRLDELRGGHREERRVGLARDCAREQRLARAGRAVEQHAARNPGAELA